MLQYAQSPIGGAGVLLTPETSRASIPEDFWIEWHPTLSVLADVPEASWVKLSGKIRELDCWHGFDRTSARVESGELIVVFDNTDRSLDPNNRQGPWWPNLGPMRHVRVRAQANGLPRTIWQGIITGTKPDWSIRDGWMTLTARDSLVTAARDIADTMLDTAIKGTFPAIWLPLRDPGALYPENRGIDGNLFQRIGETKGGDDTQYYADQPSTSFPYTGSSLYQMLLPANYQVNHLGFSMIAVFKSEQKDAGQVVFSAGPFPAAAACPSGDVAFVVDTGGTYSLRVGNASGSSLLQFAQPHNDVGTMIYGMWNPTQTGLEATIGVGTIGGGAYDNSTLGGTWYPRAGYVRIGAGLDASNSANPFMGSLNHFAFWNRVLTQDEKFNIYRGYFGRPVASAKAQDVINWVLDRLGIAAARRDIATASTLLMGGMNHDANAVDLMSRAAATDGGYFFADRSGRFIFRVKGHKGVSRGTYDTDPPAGSGRRALADLTPDVDDRTFYTVAKSYVTDKGEAYAVTYTHPNAAKYGEIIFDDPTMYGTYNEALKAAVERVGKAEPKTDIIEAVIQMGMDGVEPGELLDSEVLDTAKMVARIPGQEAPEPVMRWGEPGFWASLTLRDTVSRANSATTPGSTEKVLDATETQAWVVQGGTFGVTDNRIYKVVGGADQHDAINVNSYAVDHEVEATLNLGTWYTGFIVRATNASNFILAQFDMNRLCHLYVRTAGVFGLIGVVSAQQPAGPGTYSMRATGTLIEVMRNGVVICSGTTAAHPAATRAGIYLYDPGTTNYADDIRVSALPIVKKGWAGPPPFEQESQIMKVGHNYNRGEHVWRTRWAMSPST